MIKTIETMEGLICLEDGTVFKGKGFGFKGTAVGELVFNTAMTGYQEILTDPSYKGQIINMTYPIIGSYGISEVDNESDHIQAFGLVIKDLCDMPSNSMSVKTLDQWMKEHGVPGVYGVDSRMITKRIRNNGTVKCLISTEGISISEAKARCAEGVLRGDWMKEVTVKEKAVMEAVADTDEKPLNVAVLDMGAKGHILQYLREKNCRLTLYPYGTKPEDILADDPDGLLISNGPGNPAEADEAVETVKYLIARSELPMFGISLGHQILAMALGGQTYKLKYGHRGGNHGVYDKETKRSYITTQNHGYAVKHDSIILKGMEVTHLNLNDGTVEGMEHRDLPIFSVQFVPETSKGSNDSGYLFDKFINMMKKGDAKNA